MFLPKEEVIDIENIKIEVPAEDLKEGEEEKDNLFGTQEESTTEEKDENPFANQEPAADGKKKD
jgi:hypothetical protein